jgi:riboflavin synthase
VFTGIIETIGYVDSIKNIQGDLQLKVNARALPLKKLQLGDSISTNGVCLTVIQLYEYGFLADVSKESLSHTLIGQWKAGTCVNIEQAATLSTRLGGHIVTGHVDGVGQIVKYAQDARSIFIEVTFPKELRKYIAAKGSITIDGVSLTINAVNEQSFELNIVPHTVSETIIQHYQLGQSLHVEIDLVARYVERMLQVGGSTRKDPIDTLTPSFLEEHGFWK